MTATQASDKQINFIKTLIETRDVPASTLETIEVNMKLHLPSMAEASRIIGTLLACKPMPKIVETEEPLTDGMYRNPTTGAIFKIQYNRAQGDGRRLYAKRLVQHSSDDWGFEYAAGAMREIKSDWRMTLEQAKEFGALYGTCCVCGRTLTDETSIEMGIGPICARKAF